MTVSFLGIIALTYRKTREATAGWGASFDNVQLTAD